MFVVVLAFQETDIPHCRASAASGIWRRISVVFMGCLTNTWSMSMSEVLSLNVRDINTRGQQGR
jgi:hypothetical protein